jgi:cbb3-type cytochrome oxidase maturation protein
MEVIYSLIPGMIFLGILMVGIMIWAIRKGQYDDFEGDANRILMDEDDQALPKTESTKDSDNRKWPDAD